MPSKFYEEDDAEQILKLAAAKQGVQGALTRERLLETAAELGISPEAVEAAEIELASRRTQDEDMREFIQIQRRGFYSDLITYFAICGFFAIRELHLSGGFGWTYWMIFGWGLGLLSHARSAFDSSSRDFQRAFDRWKASRESKDTEGPSIQIGIHAGRGGGSHDE